MRTYPLLLVLIFLPPAQAQIVPAEPTPAESAREIGAQAAKDPEAAGAALSELFRELASPRIVLPTWQEVRQDRLRRDLEGPPSADPAPDSDAPNDSAPACDQFGRRESRESVDTTLSRPFARIGLGVGWAETDVQEYDRRAVGDQSKYLFLDVDLPRLVRPARLLPAPIVLHTDAEIGPGRVSVSQDEHVVRSLNPAKD